MPGEHFQGRPSSWYSKAELAAEDKGIGNKYSRLQKSEEAKDLFLIARYLLMQVFIACNYAWQFFSTAIPLNNSLEIKHFQPKSLIESSWFAFHSKFCLHVHFWRQIVIFLILLSFWSGTDIVPSIVKPWEAENRKEEGIWRASVKSGRGSLWR